MSPYQVIWEPSAWKRARTMWETSTNKRAFNNARKQIKKSLGNDPHGNGIALSEGLWRISCPPLLVCYSIDTPNMQVVISDVYEIA
jgi:hypothetical protein